MDLSPGCSWSCSSILASKPTCALRVPPTTATTLPLLHNHAITMLNLVAAASAGKGRVGIKSLTKAMHPWRKMGMGMASEQVWGHTGSWMPSAVSRKKKCLFLCGFTVWRRESGTRSNVIFPSGVSGTIIGPRVEEWREGNQLTQTVIPALPALPISFDAQCLLCRQHSALSSLGKFSAEVIQVNAARMALGWLSGTAKPRAGYVPCWLSQGLHLFFPTSENPKALA